VSTSPSRPTRRSEGAPGGHTPRDADAAPVGLAKPNSARPSGPGRQTTPADSPDHLGPYPAGSVATATPVAEADTATGSGYPSRPDPSDPAREVWKLVERAQNGDTQPSA